MGRRRFQQPSIFRTTGKRPMWFFRARVDTITTKDGARTIARPEERYYIGYCDEMTKSAAKKLRDEILANGINKPQILIPSQVKFAEVLTIYKRDHLSGLRETTRRGQESAIRKHLEPGLGNLRMCAIDSLAIQQWLSRMEVSYYTKQFNLTLLRVVWHKAEDWGFTQQPFPRQRFVLGTRKTVKGTAMPTMEQLRRLLLALPDPYRAMAEIALYSGLRISEVRGLKWTDIEGGTLTMSRRISQSGSEDVPKNGRSRVFDVRPLTGVLGRLPRKSEWLFDQAGASYRNCLYHFHQARKAAGITIPRFGWHHLRAAFNTLARDSGADAVDRQALMGHSTEHMNALYVHQSADDLRKRGDLMMAVQNMIFGETKGKVQ